MWELRLKNVDRIILYAIVKFNQEKNRAPNGKELMNYLHELVQRKLPFFKEVKIPKKTTTYDSIKKLEKYNLIQRIKTKQKGLLKLSLVPTQKGFELVSEFPISSIYQILSEKYEDFSKIIKTTISTGMMEYACYNILLLFLQSLYFDAKDIAQNILMDLEKYAPDASYALLAYSVLATITDEKKYWEKTVEIRLKYAEKLASEYNYSYASISYFTAGKIEIEKLNRQSQGMNHINKAIDLFLQDIYDDNVVISLGIFKDEYFEIVRYLLLQTTDKRREWFVDKIFHDIDELLNQKKEETLYALDNLERIFPWFTHEEKDKIQYKMRKGLKWFFKKVSQMGSDFDVFAWDSLTKICTFINFEKSMSRYLLKIAKYYEEKADTCTQNENLKVLYLRKALKSYERTKMNDEWERVAKKIIVVKHENARNSLSANRLLSFYEQLLECQELCEKLKLWEAHELLCKTGIERAFEESLEEFKRGNYFNAISSAILCAKLCWCIKDSVNENRCSNLIQKCLRVLKFSDPFVYLTISCEYEINKYLKEHFNSLGYDEAREYSKKSLIAKYITAILEYTEELKDTVRWLTCKDLSAEDIL
ncbi:MAG: hypothetical protein QXS37_04455 [Candidatus Aenigmatarchaeota archaeon]